MRQVSLLLFFFIVGYSCKGQSCSTIYSGTKTLYPEPVALTNTTPRGYRPVFINHVSRHGARHLTKDVNTSMAYAILQRADSIGLLTEAGKRLRAMVLLLEKIEKTTNKSISYKGISEQKNIAARMYAAYPALFTAPLSDVMVTKEKRTVQSADAFLSGLPLPGNTINKYVNDTILRFYDLNPAYLTYEEKGDWETPFQQLRRQVGYDSLVRQIADRFFIPGSSSFTAAGKAQLVSDIFGFALIIASIQKEIKEAGYQPTDLDFTSFFTCTELSVLGKTDNAEDFLLKGPGVSADGIQVKIAAPLLQDFITTTDAFIATQKNSVCLRFSHAEAVAPFASLLGITGASEPVTDILSFDQHWKAEEIVPLSANIQWILYRKKNSRDLLIKILLNEKPVAINGLSKKSFPYYHWNDLKKLYLQKLHTLGLEPEENAYRFLQELK